MPFYGAMMTAGELSSVKANYSKSNTMNRLFGRSKGASAEPKPTLEDANRRMDSRVEAIDGRVGKIDQELLKLKDMIQRSRGPTQQRFQQRAMQLLQQKRMYEGQRSQMQTQQFNMEQMQFSKEMMQDTKLQLDVMKGVSKELKKEFKNFSPAQVEKMQDELRDLYEDAQEIQEIMGRDYAVDEGIDEDDLREELDALAFDMEKEKDASYIYDALDTPSAPTGRLPELPGRLQDAPIAATTEPESLEAQLGL